MRKLLLILSLIFFIGLNQKCLAQTDTTNKLTTKQKIIIGGLAAQQAASFYIEYNWWWKNNYHPLHVQNDGGINNYSLGIDKVGHFYTSYFYYNAVYELMEYGNFSNKAKTITAIALPAAWAISIELGDGFSRFAFNPDDLAANFLGIAYGLAQTKLKPLKAFNFKFSYYPTQRHFDNNFKGWVLSADYDGHIYWLTTNLNTLSPKAFNNNFFKYFNIGVGYSINNFPPGVTNAALTREYMIGIDYNLRAINIKSKALKHAVNILDNFHIPAPGVKLAPNKDAQYHLLLLN